MNKRDRRHEARRVVAGITVERLSEALKNRQESMVLSRLEILERIAGIVVTRIGQGRLDDPSPLSAYLALLPDNDPVLRGV